MKKVNTTILFLTITCFCYPQENKFDFERIEDNSFLIEEAYNQETKVIQHISAFQYLIDKTWIYTFTEEWPLSGQKHQISLTIPVLGVSYSGFGDIILNYRFQAFLRHRTAFSPRFSVILPTGDSKRGLGNGVPGYQINLPFSFIASPRFVTHYNLGTSVTFAARDPDDNRSVITTLNYGASVIYLLSQNFNFMLELAGNSMRTKPSDLKAVTRSSFYINPGFRMAFNFKSGLQIVPGLAFPIGNGKDNYGIFLYLSFEHSVAKKTSHP